MPNHCRSWPPDSSVHWHRPMRCHGDGTWMVVGAQWERPMGIPMWGCCRLTQEAAVAVRNCMAGKPCHSRYLTPSVLEYLQKERILEVAKLKSSAASQPAHCFFPTALTPKPSWSRCSLPRLQFHRDSMKFQDWFLQWCAHRRRFCLTSLLRPDSTISSDKQQNFHLPKIEEPWYLKLRMLLYFIFSCSFVDQNQK